MRTSKAKEVAPVKRHATISHCGTYRYWLERSWAETGRGFVNWIMLNPSTADGEQDDATVRKCIGFARRWGFDAMHIVNLFAVRSSDPAILVTHRDPIGPQNDDFILAGVLSAEKTILAWGADPCAKARAGVVIEMIGSKGPLERLGANRDGSPKHPLYVPYSAAPERLNI